MSSTLLIPKSKDPQDRLGILIGNLRGRHLLHPRVYPSGEVGAPEWAQQLFVVSDVGEPGPLERVPRLVDDVRPEPRVQPPVGVVRVRSGEPRVEPEVDRVTEQQRPRFLFVPRPAVVAPVLAPVAGRLRRPPGPVVRVSCGVGREVRGQEAAAATVGSGPSSATPAPPALAMPTAAPAGRPRPALGVRSPALAGPHDQGNPRPREPTTTAFSLAPPSGQARFTLLSLPAVRAGCAFRDRAKGRDGTRSGRSSRRPTLRTSLKEGQGRD